MSEWLPIETAHGRECLFYGSTRHDRGVVFSGYIAVNGRPYADGGDAVKPTHWMPLPAPPRTDKEQDDE